MRRNYYDDDEAVIAYRTAVSQWLGVPFRANSRDKVAGVDCAGLQLALQVAGGAVEDFPIPKARLDHHWHNDASVMEAFLESELSPIEGVELRVLDRGEAFMTGDVLLLRWGRCAHHMAGFFGFGKLVHVADRGTVSLVDYSDDRFRKMIFRGYRFFNV